MRAFGSRFPFFFSSLLPFRSSCFLFARSGASGVSNFPARDVAGLLIYVTVHAYVAAVFQTRAVLFAHESRAF